MDYKITSYNEMDTIEFAQNLESEKFPNMVICLDGELGSGKTVFAKGFADALAIKENITSPTFTIMNIYDNKMNHFDLYRLESVEEFLAIGAEEELYSDKISLVEWPEKVGFNFFPRDAVVVSIFKRDEKMREIIMSFNEGK